MLLFGANSHLGKYGCSVYRRQSNSNIVKGGGGGRIRPRCFTRAASGSRATIGFVATAAAAAAAAAIMFSAAGSDGATDLRSQLQDQTLLDVPQTLSGECSSSSAQDCKKARIQRPKTRKAESCTIKCVTTCIRGGGGSPGEGPLNVRRPLVVFKDGFRSRQYCLVECSDICNLIGDGDDGP